MTKQSFILLATGLVASLILVQSACGAVERDKEVEQALHAISREMNKNLPLQIIGRSRLRLRSSCATL